MMLQSLSENQLTDQLLRIVHEPKLRSEVYERLGEYCHQCRNRLNSLKLGLYLVMRQSNGKLAERWRAIERDYQALERRVDEIQGLCRPLKLSRVTLGLDLLIDDRHDRWVELMARSGKKLEFDRPTERVIANFDVERVGQGLDAFVAWRAGELDSRSTAKLTWWTDSGATHLVWEESGLPSSSPIGSATSEGAIWSLPLLARIILAHEGRFEIQDEAGYRLELSWPTSLPQP